MNAVLLGFGAVYLIGANTAGVGRDADAYAEGLVSLGIPPAWSHCAGFAF